MLKSFVKSLLSLYYKVFYTIEISGVEKLPKDSGYVLCANHINFHDPVVFGSQIPDEISFMAKKELFRNKLFSKFFYFAGGFPVERDGNDLRAIKTALKILKSGQGVLIFAEGTRNKTTTPLEVKPGVAMLAIKSKVPIVPVTLDSTYKRFSKIRILIHDPVYLDQYFGEKLDNDQYKQITQDIINSVYEHLELYKGVK